MPGPTTPAMADFPRSERSQAFILTGSGLAAPIHNALAHSSPVHDG
jgi:hypothetical protein